MIAVAKLDVGGLSLELTYKLIDWLGGGVIGHNGGNSTMCGDI